LTKTAKLLHRWKSDAQNDNHADAAQQDGNIEVAKMIMTINLYHCYNNSSLLDLSQTWLVCRYSYHMVLKKKTKNHG